MIDFGIFGSSLATWMYHPFICGSTIRNVTPLASVYAWLSTGLKGSERVSSGPFYLEPVVKLRSWLQKTLDLPKSIQIIAQ